MKLIAITLVILGLVAWIHAGSNYSPQKPVFDVAGIEATDTEHRMSSIPPVVGVSSLVGGAGLLVFSLLFFTATPKAVRAGLTRHA